MCDEEVKRFHRLKGRYKHYCPDWDFMAIDETTPEWEACTCYDKNSRPDESDKTS